MNKKINFVAGLLFLCFLGLNSCDKSETPEKKEAIPYGKVNGFLINTDGEKLLATDLGLYQLNETDGKIEAVDNKTTSFPLNDLAYSNSNSAEELWLATNSGALNFNTNKTLTETNSGLHNNKVNLLNFDFDNRVYFVTSDGISILDDSEWTKTLGLNDLYLNFEITDIATASNGYTYVTTSGGGVERFKMEVDGITGATVFETDWTKLESNTVHTVFIDSITQVYGTDAGVAIHLSEYTKWDWQIFSTTDGLINDTVISVAKDIDENWWFGTTNGISRFDNITWTSFTVETDNLISNYINFLAVDTDGTIWIATDEGLSHFINNQWKNYKK